MKKEIEQYDYIIRYLNGQLEGSQIEDFRMQLANDPDFAIAYENVKKGHDVITEKAYLHLKNELKTIHTRHLKFNTIKKWLGGIGLSSIVIGFIIFLGIKYNHNSEQTNPSKSQVPNITNISGDTVYSTTKINSNKNENISHKSNTNQTEKQILSSTSLEIERPQAKDSLSTQNKKKELSIPVGSENMDITEKNNTLPAENTNKYTTKKTDCKKVKIKAELISTNSIGYKPEGKIAIKPNSLEGGAPPYTFSVNKVLYTDSFIISGLYPGNYNVYARDANNCLSKLGFIRIESVNNTYQYAFAPLKGEIWTVPLKQEGEGIMKIFTKSGVQVFTVKINPGDILTWNGETLTGQQLPMGVYMFQIDYTDGSTFTGNVTIIK